MREECRFGNWTSLETVQHCTSEMLSRIALLVTLMNLLIGSLFFDTETGIVAHRNPQIFVDLWIFCLESNTFDGILFWRVKTLIFS